MKRFVIEREIPGVGTLEREQFREAAQKSNSVVHQFGPDIQWVQSYVWHHRGPIADRLAGHRRGLRQRTLSQP